MFPPPMIALAEQTLQDYQAAGLRIATAESCTGGLIIACLTGIAGSSHVVERGFVTYSNEAKTELIGVPVSLIAANGAVSAEVAEAMALGALDHSRADIGISVTGIAGPGGGTPTKPVGLVYLATARRGRETAHERHVFPGNRTAVRMATTERALHLLRQMISPKT